MGRVVRPDRALSLVSIVGALCFSAAAHAETKPGPKALAGGALLGAELAVGAAALLDAKPWWVYLVSGAAAAGGGGLAGYYVDRGDDPRLSTLILASGMALAIPAAVLVIDRTLFRQRLDYTHDSPPVGSQKTRLKSSFFHYENEKLTLGMPSVELHRVYSDLDVLQFGVSQRSELRLKVLQWYF